MSNPRLAGHPTSIAPDQDAGGSDDAAGLERLGPWNPGISSTLPRQLYPLVTILSNRNAAMQVSEIEELAKFSGLPMQSVSELKPERLVLHEILVRVMTELSIDDGPTQGDLGANFRKLVSILIDRHFAARMPEFRAAHAATKCEISRLISEALRAVATPPSSSIALPVKRFGWSKLWRRDTPAAPQSHHCSSPEEITLHALGTWRKLSDEAHSPLARSSYSALHKAGAAIASRQGSIIGRTHILHRLATAIASNEHASESLGDLIEPLFYEAVATEGFALLPTQSSPIVMSTKGASAAGKSTLRPKQRSLAERIGANWHDFAIISPDIWRKQLLDYSSLGSARRYAGTLTAHEVEIIDRKLDRHVTVRAQAGRRTHMLIDRFRFDSFAPEGAEDNATQLLTRFGSEVYLFFMITPPEATVERAWTRGETVGRYKAVDDLLAHNVEAYTGIPGLFFRWAASTDKIVHYEFLDNNVAEGDTPRTVAFGRNGQMAIVDLDRLLDIDRFKKINISAVGPEHVYQEDGGSAASNNLEFLCECIKKIPRVVLAAHDTGEVYAEFASGAMTYWRHDVFAGAVGDRAARALLCKTASAADLEAAARVAPQHIAPDPHRTLGAWGGGWRPAPEGLARPTDRPGNT